MENNDSSIGPLNRALQSNWRKSRDSQQDALVGRPMVTKDGQPVEPTPAYVFDCVRNGDVNVAPTFLGAVAELHQQTGFSYDLCLSALLAAASAAVQTCADCVAKKVPLAPTGLYIAVSGESGVGKSAVGKHAFKPITEFNAVLIASAISAQRKAEQDLEEWEAELKLIQKSGPKVRARTGNNEAAMAEFRAHQEKKPKGHTIPQLIINAGTPEGLVAAMVGNPYGVVIPSYEGGLFLEGRLSSSLPLLNATWSGEAYDSLLASGKRTYIPDPRMVMFVCAQGVVWKKFFASNRRNARGNGYLARNLFVRVAYPISVEPCGLAEEVAGALDRFGDRIQEMLARGIARHIAGEERAVITLSDAASPRWSKIREEIRIEKRKGGLYEDAGDHAAKLPENILRVAAVIHMLEGFQEGISEEVLDLAYLICLQYSMEFLCVFCQHPDIEEMGNLLMATLERYAGNSKRMISKSYMANRVPEIIKGKRNYDRVISYLVDKKMIAEVMYEGSKYLDIKPTEMIPSGEIFWAEYAIHSDKK